MKRYIAALFLMVLCASSLIVFVSRYKPWEREKRSFRAAGGPGKERTIEEIVGMVGPSVVAINTKERRLVNPRFRDPLLRYFFDESDFVAEVERIGSGVIFDPRGYVLTNAHVVQGVQKIEVTLADGRQVRAGVCASDQVRDIALLELPQGKFTVAKLGDSDNLSVGQWVLAFGNPFGTASQTAQSSVSAGIISALHRKVQVQGRGEQADLIQTDAAVNSGNDGGPLVDLSGRAIGLNTLILTSSGASTGVSFALPINDVLEDMDGLIRRCEERQSGEEGKREERGGCWSRPWRF